MPNETKKHIKTFVYLGALGSILENYAKSDPRFSNKSECARHLIEKGIKADKAARDKALNQIE